MARNRGSQEARGDWLVFLDSDDLLFRNSLETYSRIITEGDASLIADAVLEFSDEEDDPNSDVAYNIHFDVKRYPDYLSAADNAGVTLGAGMMVVKREVFLESGGFPAERVNCEDHDLAIRLGTASGFVQIVSPPTLMYRRHGDSLTAQAGLTKSGVEYLLKREKEGAYPGGSARQRERRRILTRHVRPVTVACLRSGDQSSAWRLYRSTFGWHLQQGAWKYLFGFPFYAVKTLLF